MNNVLNNRGEIDILCVGEVLVDFIGHQEGVLISGTRDYHRYLGGSPTNVALNTTRLGLNAYLVATGGNDNLGEFILDTLNANKVNSDYYRNSSAHTSSVIYISKSLETPYLPAISILGNINLGISSIIPVSSISENDGL